ncbi:thermonuclease family protein [Mycoplasma tauri]|uniref:thermonuclease family protein n=1 Tax=Mycoplasma tauri TaxID=547987 RepID=UPI001CBCE47A|nr:hypothetical protein [Mycoplasma tauri]MBZ4218174.1 hypothetical protein [Mycoplasma tauri]
MKKIIGSLCASFTPLGALIAISCGNSTSSISKEDFSKYEVSDDFVNVSNAHRQKIIEKINANNFNYKNAIPELSKDNKRLFSIGMDSDGYFLYFEKKNVDDVPKGFAPEEQKDVTIKRPITYSFIVVKADQVFKKFNKVSGTQVTHKDSIDFTLHATNSIYTSFEKIKPYAFEFKNIDWESLKGIVFDGEIVNHSDGDTFTVRVEKIDQSNTNYKVGQEVKIRINGIDTPEKQVGGRTADDFERSYAELSSRFGRETFKTGQKVKVFYTGIDAFGRTVGDIFFGDKFQYLYSLEITRAGLTLPAYDGTLISLVDNIPNKKNIEHYFSWQAALAMKQAIEMKNGFYKTFETPFEVERIYRMKSNTKWRIFFKDSDENIFTINDSEYAKSKDFKIEEMSYNNIN